MCLPRNMPCIELAFLGVARFLFMLEAVAGMDISGDGQQIQEPGCELAIGCSCEDLGPVIGVFCRNVTDFKTLSGHLGDGSLYDDPLVTYEITITGTATIPARSFEGLIVYRLYIDDVVTGNVSKHVFEGVKRLRRLHVRASSMTRIPDLSVISHSLRRLNFDGSLLTSVGSELQNLPLLVEVTLRSNKISEISPDAFLGTTAIQILNLSKNQLERLPPTVFDSLESLRKLELSHNRLLTVSGLLRVVRPKFIYLEHNNLTDADDILSDNMTSATSISLNNNPLSRTISERSFNGKVPNLRYLYLDNCGIEEFDVNHYKDLSHLSILVLTGNNIEIIRNQTIDFGDRLQLFLDENRIKSFEAQITYKPKRLFLSGNYLRMLGSTLHLTQMSEIEIERNRLETLVETDLQGAHSTEVLFLGQNSIRRIDTKFFVPIRNDLEVLDLSTNQILSLNGSVRYLSRLKFLNISRNFISTFSEGEFIGLNELSELYVQHNRVVQLGGELQRMPRLQFLIVSNNELTSITVHQLPKSLRYLYYKDNPMSCDCRLMPFVEWLRKVPLETDVDYCLRRGSSDNLPKKFDFFYEAQNCPRPCRCSCVQGLNGSYMQLDCSSGNLSSLPSAFLSQNHTHGGGFAEVYMPFGWRSMLLMQNVDDEVEFADRVRAINFENNRLDNVDDMHLPYDIVELRVANNELKSLPMSVSKLTRLNTISLSANPWTCDCSATEFKNWIISKAEKVLDRNETRCGYSSERNDLFGKLLFVLSDVDLCPSNVALYVSVVFSILSVLLVISAAKIAYNRYEMHVKIWLYSHGVTWVKEKDLDKDKPFDAFISFSHGDEDIVVNKIIAEIDRSLPEVRLCLHYRDFLPGEYIHVNIMNAISNSKRTVIVLSRSFLDSEWCMLEFRAAHLQALEDKVHRVIVIKLGDLPDEIDPAIKVYLDSTTYVTWGEKFFWQKLAYALPSARKHKDRETFSSTML